MDGGDGDNNIGGYRFSEAEETDMGNVHSFSVDCFRNIDTPGPTPNVEEWERRFVDGSIIILARSRADDQIAAFAFAHPRLVCGRSTLHIWLAATAPNHQRNGLMHKLLGTLEVASTGKYEELTINTYKNYFPQMYALLSKHPRFRKTSDVGEKSCFSLQTTT